MLRAAPLLLIVVAVTGLGTGVGQAQDAPKGAFRLFVSRCGFTAWTHRDFEQSPVRASEANVVGRFFEKTKSRKGYPSPYRTHYDYIQLDDKVRPVYFLKQQYRGRLLVTEKKARKLKLEGVTIQAFELAPNPEKTSPTTAQEGIAVFFRHQGAFAAFVGLAPRTKFRKVRPLFRKLAYSIRFTDGDAASETAAAGKDPYAGSELRGLPRRRAFRATLLGGLMAADTDDHVIAYHPRDRAFMKKVRRDLRAAHALYRRLFPPREPVTAVATVIVCRNTQNYYIHGGRATRAAYWDRTKMNLVVLDADQENVASLQDPSTRAGLYREAFRQYLFLFAGNPSADPWFTDGHADFFSGVVLSPADGAIKAARAHPVHARELRDAFREKKCPTLRAFIFMPRSQYYRQYGLCQAIAWSFVRFLRRSPVVEKHPTWSKILSIYYRVLRDEYTHRLEGLGDDDRTERYRAAAAARDAAHRAAFKDVDLDELGEAWRKHARKIKVPRE